MIDFLEDSCNLIDSKEYPIYANFSFEKFNPVQSTIFNIFRDDCNVVIAAQTSAGKTVCAEMFMAQEIRERGGKAMYLAPLRALAKEKIDDWTESSHHFSDLNLSICTGDYRLTEKRKEELKNSNVIVMTSEMLNSRCRNYKAESNDWLKEVNTIVIDEFHLLTVPGRGDHLECGLMKFTKISPNCRIIALSATMPNVQKITEWLEFITKRKTYLFKSNYRPCPLSIHYEEYDDEGTYEMNEESKIDAAIDILRKHPEDKFLIFTHTKNTGDKIKKQLVQFGIDVEFHNADLESKKRHEVEKKFKTGQLRAIVATSTLAWGLNLPARRVIITGVHRGVNEVETYDIFQMAGRAGRPGYDPRGDVYILLPKKKYDYHIDRLSVPKDITSQLLTHIGDADNPHYKTLAFHLVSEIHHGEIKTIEDIYAWYQRSLAYFQSMDLDESIIDKTLELLLQVGAIKENNGIYEVTIIGKISSMFYYSPFDVADLRRNFRAIFSNNLENNDLSVSYALGNVDSIRMNFVTKQEKEEMEDYSNALSRCFSGCSDSSIKGGFAYFCLLEGSDLGPLNSLGRGLQSDFDRTKSVLIALDAMGCKWNKKDFFEVLSLRVAYGVRKELVEFCKIPNIGRVRAERLYSAGFRHPKELKSNFDKVQKILNMKEEKIKEIISFVD